MPLEACEEAYIGLIKDIFHTSSLGAIPWAVKLFKGDKYSPVKGRFSAKPLEDAIKRIINAQNMSEDVLLKDGDPKCSM